MINFRGGNSNASNSNQVHHHSQHHPQQQQQHRQNSNHFQGQAPQQPQQQQQHQRHHTNAQQHNSHNHQNSVQSTNRTSAAGAAAPHSGQNRPHRPTGHNNHSIQGQAHSQQHQQQQQHHHQNNSGQPSRSSSSQHGQMGHGNQRPHSTLNNPNVNKSQNQSAQPPVNNGPPLPAVLPKGWKREEIIRTKGLSAGLVDVVYVPQPNSELSNSEIVGKKFRNKIELRKHFGTKYDTSLLDFKTGKVAQIAWRRQRRMKSIAANANNYASAAKYDTYLNLPVRQNTSVLKPGVFNVTNNHKNEPMPTTVTTLPNGQPINRTNERAKPTQLFWELRFNNLKAMDSSILDLENINDEYELDNVAKFKNFTTSNDTVLRSVAASWFLNQNKILIGQDKEFTKNVRIFIDREQPLIPQTSVKEEDIKQQEIRVKEMRKKLQLALDDLENVDRIDITEFGLDDNNDNGDDHDDVSNEKNEKNEAEKQSQQQKPSHQTIDEIEIKNIPLIINQ